MKQTYAILCTSIFFWITGIVLALPATSQEILLSNDDINEITGQNASWPYVAATHNAPLKNLQVATSGDKQAQTVSFHVQNQFGHNLQNAMITVSPESDKTQKLFSPSVPPVNPPLNDVKDTDATLQAAGHTNPGSMPVYPNQILDGEWIRYWSTGINDSALGLGGFGEWYAAIRWMPENLDDYEGYYVNRIRIFINDLPVSAVAKIWQGNIDNPEVMRSQAFTPLQESWVEIELSDPYPINTDEELWIGWEIGDQGSIFPAAFEVSSDYTGLADLLQFGTASWGSASIYGFNLSWNIEAFVSPTAGEAPEAITLFTDASGQATFDAPPGSYHYIVEKGGYFDATGSFTVTDTPVNVDLTLHPDSEDPIVTFNVDMTGVNGFAYDQHSVYLTGSFTEFATPGQSGSYELTLASGGDDPDPNNLVYTVTTYVPEGEHAYLYFSDAFGDGFDGTESPSFIVREVTITGDVALNDVWGEQEAVEQCPEPGEEDGWQAINIPFTGQGLTTCGMGNDLSGDNTISCGNNNYLNSEDIVFVFTAPSSELYHITLENASEGWSSLKLYDGCPLSGSGSKCVEQTAGSARDKILPAELVQGQEYFLVVSRWGDTCFDFDLTIDLPLECPEPGEEPGWETISLPFAAEGLTTCGMGNYLNYFNTISCGAGNYLNSEEMVFIFQAPATDLYHITLENASEGWSSLKLYDGCPLSGSGSICVTQTAGSASDKILPAELEQGQEYYLVVSRWGDTCFDFDLTIDFPLECPEPGEEPGWELISLPFSEKNLTTCGMGSTLNYYNSISCGPSAYLNSEELVLVFEAPTSDLYHITLESASESWTSLKLYDGCPLLESGSTCVANTFGSATDKILPAELEAGQTYYLVISRNVTDSCFDFDLTIDLPEVCPEPGSPGWEVITLPFAEQGLTTCGMGSTLNYYNTISCGPSAYLNSEELVLIFEAPTSELYHITMENASASWTSLKLYDGCPLLESGSTCVANTFGSATDKILPAELEAGQTYYLVISRNVTDSCFDFDLSIFIPVECPEPGEPGWELISLPFSEENLTTCGMGDDLQPFNTVSCGNNNYFDGEEVILIFDAPQTETYFITMSNASINWTSLKLYDGCPLFGSDSQCIGHTSGSSPDRILEADLEEGQQYYLVVSNWGSDCFNFDLTIDLYPLLTCPDDFEVCATGEPIVLNMAQPQGGTYSGEGVYYDEEDNVYLFDPFLVEGDQSVITYNFGGEEGNSCSFSITILPPAPAEPVYISPANNVTSLAQPITFSWESVENADAYDLYVWRSTLERPSVPSAANITETSYEYDEYLNTTYLYNWQLVAKNECFETPGEVFSFSFADLPDLIVSEITVPATGLAGSEIEITFTVENVGEAESGWLPWVDGVYLSENPEFDPEEAMLVATFENVDFLEPDQSYTNEVTFVLDEALEGNFYLFVKADKENVVSESDTENNVLRSEDVIEVVMPPYPDLEVSGVLSLSGNIVPGEMVNVGWQVENLGDADAIGGWSQRLSIISGDQQYTLGFVQNAEDLETSAILSQSASFMVPKTIGMEGDVYIRVQLTPNPELKLRPGSDAATTALSEESIAMEKRLFIVLSQSSIDEDATDPVGAQLLRSGHKSDPLAVSLEVSEEDRIIFPETVDIPAGQSGAAFSIYAIDNDLVEGDIHLEITATGDDYPLAVVDFVVIDDETASLALDIEVEEAIEGETVSVNVSRNVENGPELSISLLSSAPGRTALPSDVVIAAGETMTSFEVELVDNDIPEPPQMVILTATASGHTAGVDTLLVLDNDMPGFVFEITPDVVAETQGDLAAWGRITLEEAVNRPTVFGLSSKPGGHLVFPEEVIIPANETEIEFPVGVVAQDQPQPERQVEVFASLYLASCSCFAPEGSGGTESQQVTITGTEGPTLFVSTEPQLVPAATYDAGVLLISRDEADSEPLTVNISTDQDDIVDIAATAIIPAGETSIEVAFSTLDVGQHHVTYVVGISASADNFNSGTNWLMVSNRNMPDLVVSSLEPTSSVITFNEELPFQLTISNQGYATAPYDTDVVIFLSPTPEITQESEMLATLYTHAAIPPGESLVIDDVVDLHGLIGDYYLLAEVNVQRFINELIYANNRSEAVPVTIQADYYANASVDGEVFTGASPITISGYVRTLDEEPAPFKEVDVYVGVMGTRRVFRTVSDANGDFSIDFHPVSGEAGDYYVGASFPGLDLDEEQDTFIILGMRYIGPQIVWDLTLDEEQQGVLQIRNFSSLPLNGVQVEVVEAPEGMDLSFQPIGTLPGSATVDVGYSITGNMVTESSEFDEVRLRLTSSEGVVHNFRASYHCKSPSGYITASPSPLQTTMLQGGNVLREVTVHNIGEGETGLVSISLPEVEWMTMAGPDTVANIQPDGSAVFTLRLTPGANLPLNVPVTGSIAVNTEEANSISVPFSIETISAETGDLLVDVVNEYTYNTESAPHVAFALVTLKHLYTGEIIAQGETGQDGTIMFEDIPEGHYSLLVQADQHQSAQQNVFVQMGQLNEQLVFISFQAIFYSWDVVPIGIEDEYEINLIADFETNVPAPVVIIDMPDELPELGPGEFFPFIVTITNYGLITAQDVSLSFQENNTYEFTFLFDEMDLPAMTSIQVPVLAQRKTTSTLGSNPPCVIIVKTPYLYECGPYTVPRIAIDVFVLGGPHCVGSGATLVPNCVNCSSGSASLNPQAVIASAQTEFDCDDCRLEQLEWIRSCVACNVPHPAVQVACLAYDMYDCATGLYTNCAGGVVTLSCGEQIVRCSPDPISSAFFCGYDLASPCLLGPPADGGGGNGSGGDTPETFAAIQNLLSHGASADDTDDCCSSGFSGMASLADDDLAEEIWAMADIAIAAQEALVDWALEIYGDSVWFEVPRAEINYFRDYLETLDLDNHISITPELVEHAPGNISEVELISYIERRNNTLDKENGLPYDTENYISLSYLNELSYELNDLEEQVLAKGFASMADMVVYMFETMESLINEDDEPQTLATGDTDSNRGGGAVCARITLQFTQTLTMTREAFEGTLTLFNGHEEDPIENFMMNVEIRDANGVNSNHLFEINTLSLNNLTGVDGGGVLESGESGSAILQFIPTRDAAPTEPVDYSFGGTISYLDPFTGTMVHKILYPITLTVNPSPDLHIDYFLQRDILGNDPLTDVIEPSIPAELAVMINNKGAGTAQNLTIESAQPEIIDNEKGLLIDFEIIGSSLDGEDVQLGLMEVDFGDLEGGNIAVGQWWFTSSLLGHFVSYDVNVNHLSSYGNPDLSLVTRVDVHELIRSVRVYGEDDDGISDFLVNNIPDADDIPDALYYSTGEIKPVYLAESAEVDGLVSVNNLSVELTVEPSETGWNYARLSDPGDGLFRIVSCTREDGQEIPLDNVWLTHVRIPDGGTPIYENNMHIVDIFDALDTQSYTVVFEPVNQDVPEVVAINGIPEEVIDTPLTSLEVVFNKPIDPDTFTYEDMVLSNQGGPNLMDESVVITQLSDKMFEVNIATLTNMNGLFALTVQTAGIADLEGNLGQVGKQVTWIQGLNVPAIVRFFGQPFEPGDAIDVIYAYFNMPVDAETFTNQQLLFESPEGEILSSEDLVVTQISQNSRLFRISELLPLNLDNGTYNLTVKVTEIFGESGQFGVFDQSVQWTIADDFSLIVDAGPDDMVCEGSIFFLSEAFTNAPLFSWSGGDGYFEDLFTEFAYMPGTVDTETGFVNLCITAVTTSGVSVATDCMTLTINPLPEASCPDNMLIPYDALPLTLSGATPEGGVFSGVDVVDGIFHPTDENIFGNRTVNYTFVDEFGCSSTCSFIIRVDTVPPVDLRDIVVTDGEEFCHASETTIMTTDYVIESGGSVNLVAARNILLQPGTHIQAGAYLHAFIDEDPFAWCDQAESIVKVSDPVKDDTASADMESPLEDATEASTAVFIVYPNPTGGLFTLELTGVDFAKGGLAEVYSMMGELIVRSDLTGDRLWQFNLSDQPRGVYLVRVLYDNEMQVFRLIKR